MEKFKYFEGKRWFDVAFRDDYKGSPVVGLTLPSGYVKAMNLRQNDPEADDYPLQKHLEMDFYTARNLTKQGFQVVESGPPPAQEADLPEPPEFDIEEGEGDLDG